MCLLVCARLCDSSIGKCQTPQALDVSSRPPHLHDHVSPPVGEEGCFSAKRRKKEEVLHNPFQPIKSRVHSGLEVLSLGFLSCFIDMGHAMM